MQPDFTLSTARLTLCMPTPAMIPAWQAAIGGLSTAQKAWLPVELRFESTEDVQQLIYTQMAFWVRGEDFMFAITHHNGGFLGAVQVHAQDIRLPAYEIGYFLGQEHQGQGYTAEAVNALIPWIFTTLAAKRIIIATDPANAASTNIAKTCGFSLEGTHKLGRQLADGHLVDNAIWARTA